MKLKVITGTPSRYAKWLECPAKVKYEDLLHLCPACFKGKISGGFDGEPVVCDFCSKPQPARGPLDRGNRLDAALLQRLTERECCGKGPYEEEESEDLAEAIRHPKIRRLVKTLSKAK